MSESCYGGVLLLPVMLFIIQSVTCQYFLIVPLETGVGC